MKFLFFTLFFSTFLYADFDKPKLVARFMYSDAWNVPDNVWCLGGESASIQDKIYLNCLDVEGSFMASWENGHFRNEVRAKSDNLFSKPLKSFNRMSWYEYDEFRAHRSFLATDKLVKIEINNLGPLNNPTDSFHPIDLNTFFFKSRGDVPKLWIWRNDKVESFFAPQVSYIFSPQIGANGKIVLKTRELHLGEDAPDKIWLYDGQWRVILEDQSSNPLSVWKRFRHQFGIYGDEIVVIAHDGSRDNLISIKSGKIEVIAREGIDLKSFDYFSPQIGSGVVLIRGVDFDNRKAIYEKSDRGFRKLVTEGDIVKTDLGDARIFYREKHAIFYGAPSIDEFGNIIFQATLTDADYPSTLFGVGLIRVSRRTNNKNY